MAKTLYFVRHGQTEWNVQRRLQGRADSPLTAVGERQARAHHEWLRLAPPQAIIASPLGRVRATVALINEALDLVPEFDGDLSERCMGEFEGRSIAQIAEDDPASAAVKERDPWHWLPPGGEDYDAMMVRTAPVVARLAHHPAERTLVVSHGTIVRPILKHLLHLDRATTLRISSPNELAYRLERVDEETWSVTHWTGTEWTPGLQFL
ncbi:MAG: histidine phosphatase family protein [Pseudomonadota bacterium]